MVATIGLRDVLLERLREQTGVPALSYETEPTPLTGGFWAELATFRLADPPAGWGGDLVARVMPDPGIATKETAFQAGVAAQGYATPAVIAAGRPDQGIDGRAYLVMPLVAGAPLLAGLDGARALAKLPSLARNLPVVEARVLADLHRLDPTPIRDQLTAQQAPVPGLTSMLEHLHDTAAALDRDDLADATTWLQAHRPAGGNDVICHGDLHPFNVLVDDTGATTVLDWSAATIAPADYDLGFSSLMLAQPPLVAPGLLRPVVRAAGRALSRRFIRAYQRASGRKVDPASLSWHQGLICVRALVEVAGWAADGTLDDRGGHPWVIGGDAFAARLRGLTGVGVTPR